MKGTNGIKYVAPQAPSSKRESVSTTQGWPSHAPPLKRHSPTLKMPPMNAKSPQHPYNKSTPTKYTHTPERQASSHDDNSPSKTQLVSLDSTYEVDDVDPAMKDFMYPVVVCSTAYDRVWPNQKGMHEQFNWFC